MLYEVFETGQSEIVRKLYVPANFKVLIEDAKKEIQESKLKKNESVTPVFLVIVLLKISQLLILKDC